LRANISVSTGSLGYPEYLCRMQGFAHAQRDKDVKIARVVRNGRRRETACLLAFGDARIRSLGPARSGRRTTSLQNSSKHVPRSQDYSGNTMREPTLKSRRERTFMAVRTLCSAVREEVIRGRHYDETALCCAPVRDWHRNHCGSSSDRHWPGPPAQSDGTAEQELFDFDGRDRRPSWRISRRRHHRPRPLDWTTKRPR
jgi:hypothetical protein